MDFSTIEITSKQVRENNLDFLTIEITSKKYVEMTWIFRPSKLHRKSSWNWRGYFDHRNYIEKSTWNQRGYFDHRNYIEKVHGIDVENRRNLVFTYRRNIYIESTSIRRGVPVGRALHALMSHGPYSLRALVSHMFRAIRVSYPSCLCASFVLFLALANASCALSSMSFITLALLLYGLTCLTCTLWLVPCMIQVKISTFVDLCFHVSRCFKFKFISYLWAFLGNLLRLTWT